MLDRLEPNEGARHRRKRLGRGPGSGTGRYCGHGVKGQGTRSGSRNRPARFEGGQMPLARRLPKRGFANLFRTAVAIVNLGDLATLGEGAVVDPEVLVGRKLVRRKGIAIKLLAGGDAPAKLQVRVHRVSSAARQKIEAAGGSVELLDEKGLRG